MNSDIANWASSLWLKNVKLNIPYLDIIKPHNVFMLQFLSRTQKKEKNVTFFGEFEDLLIS